MVINYLALYRKYRPSTFDDVVGQEENIKILTNAVLNNMISHAYFMALEVQVKLQWRRFFLR